MFLVKNRASKTNIVNKFHFKQDEEEIVFKYAIGCYISRRKFRKLTEEQKLDSFGAWERGVQKRYCTFNSGELLEFSKFLNICLIDTQPSDAVLVSVISGATASMLLITIEIIKNTFSGQLFSDFCSIALAVIYFVLFFFTMKFTIKLYNLNFKKLFLYEYKKIIDELIKKKNLTSKPNSFSYFE